ncbi:MAG: ABC transporter ATP-binding protein [Candidatus Promineofilum sp.]|jgi:branched-chain amino acid transport system ATP-binding protein|nr:ABC transporter ATP-binding protein [Promineifilum sp.]MCW5862011.1 ABC transporter ATP-binding protein [Anaerolineae bacterium]
MDDSTILETRDLRRQFGGLVAVDGVSMKVQAHTLHTIIGPNGAGKTTFFNLLSGNIRPSSGRVLFKGQDITDQPAHRRAHLGIGRSFQITNVFPNLTVLENVRLAAQAVGHDSFKFWQHHRHFQQYEARAAAIVAQVGLAAQAGLPARLLPHGGKRKLELGILLAADPDLLLLDEPTAGMAREEIPMLMEVIQSVRAAGDKTIILVEHKMDLVMNVSDRISVMHQGRLLAEGAPLEIAANKTVQAAYLGDLYGDLTGRK